MASRTGMIYRNEKSQARIDAALAAIVKKGDLTIPDVPQKTRDANLNDTLHREWLATVLEAVAGIAPSGEGGGPIVSEASSDAPAADPSPARTTAAKGK